MLVIECPDPASNALLQQQQHQQQMKLQLIASRKAQDLLLTALATHRNLLCGCQSIKVGEDSNGVTCSAGDVVYNGGSLTDDSTEVCHQSIERRFAIVWVDLQRCMHANCKTLLCRVQRLPGGVAASIAYDLQLIAKAVDCVCDQHDVLIPTHQLALPCMVSESISSHYKCGAAMSHRQDWPAQQSRHAAVGFKVH